MGGAGNGRGRGGGVRRSTSFSKILKEGINSRKVKKGEEEQHERRMGCYEKEEGEGGGTQEVYERRLRRSVVAGSTGGRVGGKGRRGGGRGSS